MESDPATSSVLVVGVPMATVIKARPSQEVVVAVNSGAEIVAVVGVIAGSVVSALNVLVVEAPTATVTQTMSLQEVVVAVNSGAKVKEAAIVGRSSTAELETVDDEMI